MLVQMVHIRTSLKGTVPVTAWIYAWIYLLTIFSVSVVSPGPMNEKHSFIAFYNSNHCQKHASMCLIIALVIPRNVHVYKYCSECESLLSNEYLKYISILWTIHFLYHRNVYR